MSRSRPAGGIILPRAIADHGQVNWPKCARCMRAVDAYGIENETPGSIEIWAECRGVRIDPKTGQSVWGGKTHPTMRSSMWLMKGPGWSPNRFTDIVRRLAFFHAEGDRQFLQTLTQDGIAKRWSAG